MPEKKITARIVKSANLLPEEIAAWEQLLTTSMDFPSPFLSPHYARAIGEAGIDARVCIVSRDSKISGFLPYQYRHFIARLARAAEPIGAEMTDYFGIVAAPELRISPEELLRLGRINHFSFSHLDESQFRLGLAGEQPRTGLRIRLPLNSDRPLETLLAERNKYFKDTERRMRQLANDVGPIKFIMDVQENRRQVLDHLIQQKRAQYARTNVPDALAQTWKQHLLHKLSGYKFSSCRSILSTMSAGSQWVATHFGIIGNGVLQYWLPVYNPELAKYAPGRLLIHHIINSSGTAAIHTIDRGEGDTPSKRELANEEHRFFRGVWHNQSLSSHITRSIHSLKWRLTV